MPRLISGYGPVLFPVADVSYGFFVIDLVHKRHYFMILLSNDKSENIMPNRISILS